MINKILLLMRTIINLCSDKHTDISNYHLEGYSLIDGRIMLKIHEKHRRNIFIKSVSEIYHDIHYLSGFSKKQAAFIEVLCALEKKRKNKIINLSK